MGNQHLQKLVKPLSKVSLGLSVFAILSLIYDLGFSPAGAIHHFPGHVYLLAVSAGILAIAVRQLGGAVRPKVRLFDLLLLFYLALQLFQLLEWERYAVLTGSAWIYLAIFVVFIREFSELNTDTYFRYLNPAQLFIASFLFIILLGALLLSLPGATHVGISFIDALFTSTSAVCVTGLVVVDTGTYFTRFGQWIIVLLIQAGGIGIMTFTSYFSYFFRGGSSYENQLLLKDMTNSEKIGEVFSTLKKILLLTFTIELAGAVFIFFSLDKTLVFPAAERTFFSIFHTVSAFCNAGFSTLAGSLYEPGFRFNYQLHLIIAVLFIIGGIGFPIAFNFFKYLRHLLMNRLFARQNQYSPWVININTRIVLMATSILLIAGTFLFFFLEYNNTLAEHRGLGKLLTAFFGAATPRTAGFNSVDMAALNLPTLMIVFLLMWIGASPGSTGGGIKTTTFVIGTLNFMSIARGKDRLEVFSREISDRSVRRAFAVISLSLIAIGGSVFLITAFDPEKQLLSIAFESFSAYSTVGLSLGITADLSPYSKAVIIGTMFVGRVGMLTLLVAFLRRLKHLKYHYPTEDIMIN